MDRGIVYVMTTIVPGIVKIGQCQSNQFENRMYELEHSGYRNMTGLRRAYAVDVDSYAEKERQLHEAFSECRAGNTELFAVHHSRVIERMAGFGGEQIYPDIDIEKPNDVLNRTRQELVDLTETTCIPNGVYVLERSSMQGSPAGLFVTMEYYDGCFAIRSGQHVSPITKESLTPGIVVKRERFVDAEGLVTADVEFSSPSGAADFALGYSSSGWQEWKTTELVDGEIRTLDYYRKKCC